MIKLKTNGNYRLIETKHGIKILYLGDKSYAWVEPINVGEMLVFTYRLHKTDCILSGGSYRIYDVKNEPEFNDQLHLELEVGPDQWQGYLLLSGLPTAAKKRVRIIPTTEVITNKRYNNKHKEVDHEATIYG